MYPNIVITVVFFVIFIVLFSMYIYQMYDYMNHKNSVDKRMRSSNNELKKNLDVVSNTLSTKDADLSGRLDRTIASVTATHDDIRGNLSAVRNEAKVGTLKADDAQNRARILNTKTDALKRRFDNLVRNIDMLNSHHQGISGEIGNLSGKIKTIVSNSGVNIRNITTLARKQDEIINSVNQLHKMSGIVEDIPTAVVTAPQGEVISGGTNPGYATLDSRYSLLSDEVSGMKTSYSLLNDKHTLLGDSVNDIKATYAKNDSVKSIEDRFNTEKASIQTSIGGITQQMVALDQKHNTMQAEIQAISSLSSDQTFTENVGRLTQMYADLNVKHNEIKSSIDALQNIVNSSFIQISKIQGLQSILDGIEDKQTDFLKQLHDLNTAAEATSVVIDGLYIKSSSNLVDPKNFKICNTGNDCMNFNTNNDGFNMTPENVNSFTIRSKNKTAIGKFNLLSEDLYLTGKVGIGTNTPSSKLEVVADSNSMAKFISSDGSRGLEFKPNSINPIGYVQNQDLSLSSSGNGVVRINSRTVVNNSIDGGSSRGIAFWNSNDTGWGMYMSRSGNGKSFSNEHACTGVNFNGYAIRLRTSTHATQGLIYENVSEQCLMSIRSTDGMTYFRGNVGVQMQNPRYPIDVRNAMQITTVNNDAEKSILYLGTPQNTESAPKCAMIAEGINSWSRSKLHFCLENTANNGSTNIASVQNSRMTIQPNGFVGIGTTTPQSKLDVIGNAQINGSVSITGSITKNSVDIIANLQNQIDELKAQVALLTPS